MTDQRTHDSTSAVDDPLPLHPFHVTTTARATIREHWTVAAYDQEHAQQIAECIAAGDHEGHVIESAGPDETMGDEEDRAVETVELFVAPPAFMTARLTDAIAQLRDHQTQIDADGAMVGVSREALDIALFALNEVRPVDVDAADLRNQLMQMADSAMRMELVIRMIRIYAMADFLLAESGMVRDWLRDWIDGNHHGPVGGPLLWPGAIGSAARQLTEWGFTRSDGTPAYVVLKRAPAAGEMVN